MWQTHLAEALLVLVHLSISQQSTIQALRDGLLLHVAANEHNLLPPISKCRAEVKVLDDHIPLHARLWPFIVRHSSPPAHEEMALLDMQLHC